MKIIYHFTCIVTFNQNRNEESPLQFSKSMKKDLKSRAQIYTLFSISIYNFWLKCINDDWNRVNCSRNFNKKHPRISSRFTFPSFIDSQKQLKKSVFQKLMNKKKNRSLGTQIRCISMPKLTTKPISDPITDTDGSWKFQEMRLKERRKWITSEEEEEVDPQIRLVESFVECANESRFRFRLQKNY